MACDICDLKVYVTVTCDCTKHSKNNNTMKRYNSFKINKCFIYQYNTCNEEVFFHYVASQFK